MTIGEIIGARPGTEFITMQGGCNVSPPMLDAIYAFLLVLMISLCIIGLVAAGRWVDQRLEGVVRWFQLREVNRRFARNLTADVIHLNDRSE